MQDVNVWKIGSRWGNPNEPVVYLFRDYGCVFFGEADKKRIGDWKSVRAGDLFVISEGATPIAIAEARGSFAKYEECGIRFREADWRKYIDENVVVVCKAKIIFLDENAQGQNWSLDPRKRFCRVSDKSTQDSVKEHWKRMLDNQDKGLFEIKTRVVSLIETGEDKGCGGIFSSNVMYKIPIYQRPYSWGEQELRSLLEDIKQGLDAKEPIFLGTMQLGEATVLDPRRNKRSYDVIDGQQRLSTFLILLSILEKLIGGESVLLEFARLNFSTSVNNRAAQDDFDEYLEFIEKLDLEDPRKILEGEKNKWYISNRYICNALSIIEILMELADSKSECEGNQHISNEEFRKYASDLYKFLVANVRIVVLETHAGLSKTLKIFNTINSTGLDLGTDDLFKVKFYEYRQNQGDGEEVFERISNIYEQIDEWNRGPGNERIEMVQILSTFQRYLIGKYGMRVETFTMSQERFFEQLFDTLLKVHVHPEFRDFNGVLTVGELQKIVDERIRYLKACAEDVELDVFRRMFWETRYGYAEDFPVLAMVSGVADIGTVKNFTIGLIKGLVPPSLYYAKTVSHGRGCLIRMLKGMWDGTIKRGEDIGFYCNANWKFDDLSLCEVLSRALQQDMAFNLKWKNLVCKLVEYLSTEKEDRKKDLMITRLFATSFDIEHIHPSVDRNSEWRDEIDKIGNLVMFEREKNRSVQEHIDQKPSKYKDSVYASIRVLAEQVATWKPSDAEARRKDITEKLCDFIGGGDGYNKE